MAPPKIRSYLRAIYGELTGVPLNKKGFISIEDMDQARSMLSPDAWKLYDWTRCIFAGLSTGQGRNSRPAKYLSRLLELIGEIEEGQHAGLPPMLAGVTSLVLARPSIRLPPMFTREDEQEERSLSKSRRNDAHLGYGASMTPRKAAIYGLAGSGRARMAV
ncbi:hypothetical protein JCM10296v2_004998 [Rhodotorula toruloides]